LTGASAGAYLQPPLQHEEEDAVDDGWYDEDNEDKFAQERQLDESNLGGAELWSWKSAKLQDAVRFVFPSPASAHAIRVTKRRSPS
jgi:hypothetical protein